MVWILIGISVFFVLLSTQTMYLQPKPKKDILTRPFSSHEDIWIKKEGNTKLLIMLHGMYSHPSIFLESAEAIVSEGWDVYLPVLPNASLSVEELSEQEEYQWEDNLKVAFHKSLVHNYGYQEVALAGHSQGGSLALTIAPSLPFLKGLLIIAAPLYVIHPKYKWRKSAGIRISGLLRLFISQKGVFLPSKNAEQKREVEGNAQDREFYFGLTLHSMNLALRQTRKNLKKIHIPCFLAYEKGDKVTSFNDFLYLKSHLGSSLIKEKIFEVPISIEPYSNRHKLFQYIHTKEELKKEIVSFLAQISQ